MAEISETRWTKRFAASHSARTRLRRDIQWCGEDNIHATIWRFGGVGGGDSDIKGLVESQMPKALRTHSHHQKDSERKCKYYSAMAASEPSTSFVWTRCQHH